MVAYLNNDLEPVDKAEATMVKINFTDEDNGAVFAVIEPTQNDATGTA